MEVRDLKDQIREMSGNMVVPREIVEQGAFEGKRPDFVIVRDNDRNDYASLIEDVPYEIQSEDENGAAAPPDRAAMPTLEDAERRLITEALRRFDGNRRQTARALGISERTLYRKLKEFEEDL
jgi:DNA-binding NtrC family response regulator